MYAISKKQRDEALALLAALREHPGKDTRTVNNRRRAGILIRKLENAREIDFEEVKRISKKTDDERDTE